MRAKVPRYASLLFMAFSIAGAEVLPRGLVDGLCSESFQTREKSQDDLLNWCRERRERRAASVVTLANDEDPEIRKRASEILRVLSDEDYLSDGQGYVGVQLLEEALDPGEDGKARVGVRVLEVMSDSPAQAAGLKDGDLIVALDGKTWGEAGAVNQFMEQIANRKPLTDVVFTVNREAPDPLHITVKLGKRPIPDLRLATGDLQMLDKQAKDQHYRQWLEMLKERRD